ncbi:hypothetical protein JAAARDRAFT_141596 [Jaapia argillacea MUCL 33604]|uniref:Uncharacterized protein n=1 Tax=Jaapia argillacea MUCL 33604 TaxID=933084 RepID=A0A067P6W5_9AGAM|nr:hypothetical protein JAAARDRAFT_141596 [Jaapia argillacea MUCL 33604]
MEIGALMAALFLMGKKDHYTNCKFKTFYWKSFLKEALKDYHYMSTSSGENNDEDMPSALEKERIVIQRSNEEYIGISLVMDYIFRPLIYEACSLYDWMQFYQKEKIPNNPQNRDEEDDDNDIKIMSFNMEVNVNWKGTTILVHLHSFFKITHSTIHIMPFSDQNVMH